MVGILLSYLEGLFSGAMLVPGRVFAEVSNILNHQQVIKSQVTTPPIHNGGEMGGFWGADVFQGFGFSRDWNSLNSEDSVDLTIC